jgi:hypothetical protein
VNAQELLGQRHRDYAKAQERHARALEKHQAAVERVQQLERELVEAEDEDRRQLGEALVDARKPPPRKTERARAALEKAKAEALALAYAAERAGQMLDHLPLERKSEWLREAQRYFEAARADYQQQLGLLAEARERLTEEAAVINFLAGGQTIWMGHTVRVHARGVEGLVNDVSIPDVLEALRDELADLEFAALRGARAGEAA